jgi:hypothetical protein
MVVRGIMEKGSTAPHTLFVAHYEIRYFLHHCITPQVWIPRETNGFVVYHHQRTLLLYHHETTLLFTAL